MPINPEELLSIDDDVKIRTLQMVMGTVEREFRAVAGRPPKADDVLDFYALAIGALLDADTRLRTEEDFHLGALTAATHIKSRAVQMRASHDAHGRSFYEVITSKIDEIIEQSSRPH
jgi:hypothetical protein